MSIFEILKENVQLAKETGQQAAEFAKAKANLAMIEAEIAKKYHALGTRVFELHRDQGLAIEDASELLTELDTLHQELRFARAKDDARQTGEEVVNESVPEGRLDSDRRRLQP